MKFFREAAAVFFLLHSPSFSLDTRLSLLDLNDESSMVLNTDEGGIINNGDFSLRGTSRQNFLNSGRFQENHHLKKDVELKVQHLTEDNNKIIANNKVFSLDYLEPINVYTEGASYTLDNANEVKAFSDQDGHLLTNTSDEGDTVLVVKDATGIVQTINVYGEDGSDFYLAAIEPGVLAHIRQEDIDPKFSETYKLGSILSDAGIETDVKILEEEMLQGRDVKDSTQEHREEPEPVERRLQSGCSSFNVIELAAVYDSTFCSQEGGSNAAKRKIENVVAKVSLIYQKQGVCAKVKISKMEGHCNPSTDPYRAGINTGKIGCGRGNYGVLDQFQEYWQSNRGSVHRDVAHIFYARDFAGSTIGCAYVDELCSARSGYGANQMTFSRGDENYQAVLVAHELGHNVGLNHIENGPRTNIMSPGVSTSGVSHSWSTTSIGRIRNSLSRNGCITAEAPAPTPVPPSPSPPTGGGVTCGCSSCTSSVLGRDASGHKVGDRINWVESNMGMSEEQSCQLVCGDEFPSICGAECDPERCSSSPTPIPPSPSPPTSSNGYHFYVNNKCSRSIYVAVRYLNPNTNNWESSCWYTFSSGERAYLSSIFTKNSIYYLYAESYDGELTWNGSGSPGSIYRSCGGESFTMFKRDFVNGDGDLYTSFTCSSGRVRALSSTEMLNDDTFLENK